MNIHRYHRWANSKDSNRWNEDTKIIQWFCAVFWDEKHSVWWFWQHQGLTSKEFLQKTLNNWWDHAKPYGFQNITFYSKLKCYISWWGFHKYSMDHILNVIEITIPKKVCLPLSTIILNYDSLNLPLDLRRISTL